MQIQELQDKADYLNRCSADKLGLFGGNHAQRLQYAIKKRVRDFHYKPVGPIGHYLALSDDRYVCCVVQAACMPNANLCLDLIHKHTHNSRTHAHMHAYTLCHIL